MKSYFRYEDEYVGGITYIEIDDRYAIKQITLTPNKYIASNRKDKDYDYCLPEGPLDLNELKEHGASQIKEQEFYDVWNTYKTKLLDVWNITKENFPIGKEIEGTIEIFYPQGVIIEFKPGVIGIADYEDCRKSTKPENLYPNHSLKGIIAGYDESNMWLIIEYPKVY